MNGQMIVERMLSGCVRHAGRRKEQAMVCVRDRRIRNARGRGDAAAATCRTDESARHMDVHCARQCRILVVSAVVAGGECGALCVSSRTVWAAGAESAGAGRGRR